MDTELTEDVKTMLGNPRRALFAMALPIALANILTSCNNLIDSVWLAGVGAGALTATGVVFPYYFLTIGIANGIGVGASQAIARRIGAKDYEGTHKVAAQVIYMIILASIITSSVLLVFAEPIMVASGAGEYLGDCLEYAYPIFLACPVTMVGFVVSAMLRSEGAAKRSMNMTAGGAIINIILDPIFIYVLGWGIAGAAWATVVSSLVPLMIGLWWYFGRKDTFVRIPMRNFRFDWSLDRDILRVGVPAAFEIVIMGVTTLVMNIFAYQVDPVSGIAVFGTGWRAVDLIIIPGMAVGNAMVPVCAAAYGARNTGKVGEIYRMGMFYSTAMVILLAVFTFAAAPQITALFTYGEGSAVLKDGMEEFLRYSALFMPFIGIGYCSFGFFQSLGMGTRSMVATCTTSVIRIPLCLYIMTFDPTFTGLCVGIVLAESLGYVLAGAWSYMTLRSVREGGAAAA